MNIKQLLHDNNFHFNKGYGQNFLTDQALLCEIVTRAGITAADTVIEIGAGAGTLTMELANVARRVIAFEIDTHLKGVLDATVGGYPNVEVIFADIMKYKMSDIERLAGGAFKVVANIPYYITTPLVMNFVEHSSNVVSLTLTIQKEVAARLAARHDTKDYGAITVAVQAVADVDTILQLPRELFFPAPNVDSAVSHIVFRRDKYDIKDAEHFRKVVKAAFAMRRKTLLNNLVVAFKMSREDAERVLQQLGVEPNIRGEALSVADFVRLEDILKKI
jgi:16S rRNA (adenine1518-N6/adenine1519-N6)-dimethyltransferase